MPNNARERTLRQAEQNRLADRDIEVRNRALRRVGAELRAILDHLDLRNYGIATSRLEALIEHVSDEFGTPLIVADAEEKMIG